MTLKLQDLVPEGAAVCSLEATDRDAGIAELLDALVKVGSVSAKLQDELFEKVMERERKYSTGFGLGVAVPHVKHRDVRKISAAIGLSSEGLDFQARDGQPVHSVVLLVSPEDRPDEHLHAMEALFKQLRKETFRRTLRACEDEAALRRLLAEADGEKVVG